MLPLYADRLIGILVGMDSICKTCVSWVKPDQRGPIIKNPTISWYMAMDGHKWPNVGRCRCVGCDRYNDITYGSTDEIGFTECQWHQEIKGASDDPADQTVMLSWPGMVLGVYPDKGR